MFSWRLQLVAFLCALFVGCSTAGPCNLDRPFTIQPDQTHTFKYKQDWELANVIGSHLVNAKDTDKEASIKTVTLKSGSVLLHGTFPESVTAADLVSARVKMPSWFTPDECQSTGHACKLAHDPDPTTVKYFSDYYIELGSPKPDKIPMVTYVFRTTKDIKLVLIENSQYPLIVKGVNGIINLSGSQSTDPTVLTKVNEFCAYAKSVGAVGWRQDDDQDEVMLCEEDRSGFLEVHDEYGYVCLESTIAHSAHNNCPGKKMLYGKFSVQSCHWVRHLSSDCKANKVVCDCNQEAKEVPQDPSKLQSQKPGKAQSQKKPKQSFGQMICSLLSPKKKQPQKKQ